MEKQLPCDLKQLGMDDSCLQHSQQGWPEAGLWQGACPHRHVPPALQVYGSVEDPVKKKPQTIK